MHALLTEDPLSILRRGEALKYPDLEATVEIVLRIIGHVARITLCDESQAASAARRLSQGFQCNTCTIYRKTQDSRGGPQRDPNNAQLNAF